MIRIGQLDVYLDERQILENGKAVRVGSRAFDILELLIRAEGALVSKDDIMQRVWPHTVVEENNLQVHIAALRKVLGADRHLIVTVPGFGYRLLANRYRGATADSPAESIDEDREPDRRISAAFTSLIGRGRAVDEILAAFDDARIVTLVGAGGIGKTRIASEVAAHAATRFPDGIAFASLASLSNPRCVPDAVAAAVGVTIGAGSTSLGALSESLANRRMLIVLDNCEHLIEAAAQVADTLTDTHAGLRILATSREALRVHGERLRPIAPLGLPKEGDDCDAILMASAVQLFVARARAVDPRFALDERSLPVMATICRRLDGLPLAIELAAARAAVLGIEVLARHLDDIFRMLTGGFRTALPRHQTLQAMYDWSYRLLSDTERRLLRWLGVFRGDFSLEAIQAVIEGQEFTMADILDAMTGLVSKSLVIREETHAATRYRLLATTRAYARQQLENNGERKAAALAYARCFKLFPMPAPAVRDNGGTAVHYAT